MPLIEFLCLLWQSELKGKGNPITVVGYIVLALWLTRSDVFDGELLVVVRFPFIHIQVCTVKVEQTM